MSPLPVNNVKHVGADGCKHGGWFAFLIDSSGGYRPELFADLPSLFNACSTAERILLDVPIGLSDERRECDAAAKAHLGACSPRVFFALPRCLLEMACWEDANKESKRRFNRGVSKQAWAIAGRIKQTDTFLQSTPVAREKVRECHPEICFWALNAAPIALSKKTQEGKAARIEALQAVVPGARDLVNHALQTWKRKDVAEDDIIDALVAAFTAAAPESEIQTLPSAPFLDSCGLRMEMVYRVPDEPRGH